jgi:hypothetical protein
MSFSYATLIFGSPIHLSEYRARRGQALCRSRATPCGISYYYKRFSILNYRLKILTALVTSLLCRRTTKLATPYLCSRFKPQKPQQHFKISNLYANIRHRIAFMQSLILSPKNKKPILADELFLIVITLLNA